MSLGDICHKDKAKWMSCENFSMLFSAISVSLHCLLLATYYLFYVLSSICGSVIMTLWWPTVFSKLIYRTLTCNMI